MLAVVEVQEEPMVLVAVVAESLVVPTILQDGLVILLNQQLQTYFLVEVAVDKTLAATVVAAAVAVVVSLLLTMVLVQDLVAVLVLVLATVVDMVEVVECLPLNLVYSLNFNKVIVLVVMDISLGLGMRIEATGLMAVVEEEQVDVYMEPLKLKI